MHQFVQVYSLDCEFFGMHHGCTDDGVGADGNQEMEMSENNLCGSLQDCQKLKTVRWAGTWHLAPQLAMSLLPRKNSQLLIVQGSAWITTGKPMGHWRQSDGDHFLQAGQIMDVHAGTHLVLQSRHTQEALQFDWREMPPGLVQHHNPKASVSVLARQWVQAWAQVGLVTASLARALWHARLSGRQVSDLPV